MKAQELFKEYLSKGLLHRFPGEHIITTDAQIIHMMEHFHAIKSNKEENLVKVEGFWFPVGVRLTSMENGRLIIAGPDTPDDMIVGIVSDKGLVI